MVTTLICLYGGHDDCEGCVCECHSDPKICSWCGNELINKHYRCLRDAAPAADFQTRYGNARDRWGAMPKHFDDEWYGDD